jgi:hypothetical protein
MAQRIWGAGMVKSFIAAILIVAATLAGLYVPSLLETTGGGGAEEVHVKPEPFKTDHIAVAIFEEGAVVGYFTSRLSGELLDPALKDVIIPQLTHQLHRAVYGRNESNFRKLRPEEVESLAGEIVKGANEKAGKPVIGKLTLEEPDFLRRL